MGQRDRDELLGAPGVVAVLQEAGAEDLLLEGGVVGVAVDAAGVVEQLADGDPAAVVTVAPDDTGQPLLDRVVEVDAVLRLELEQDGGGEGLGDGADAEAVVAPATRS